MNTETTTKVNNRRRPPKAVIAALLAFVMLAVSMTAYAWFYYGRKVAGISEISNPTAIFINAGNQEDIRYLDLGGIDVESGVDPDTHIGHKDFVFCVRGNNVQAYKLQLAYTTNNQFEFELYAATETSSEPSGDTLALVYYDTHSGNDPTLYYYAPAGATPIAGTLLNEDTAVTDETIAKNSDYYHNKTYTPDGANAAYTNRHKFAIPLYWQASSSAYPTLDAHFDFCDYYILRVKWTSNTKNDKETDIVYISAKNTY